MKPNPSAEAYSIDCYILKRAETNGDRDSFVVIDKVSKELWVDVMEMFQAKHGSDKTVDQEDVREVDGSLAFRMPLEYSDDQVRQVGNLFHKVVNETPEIQEYLRPDIRRMKKAS